MSDLRKRMIEYLQLRGLAERTQDAYTRAVRQLAAHYHKSPDQISLVRSLFLRGGTINHLKKAEEMKAAGYHQSGK